jgi:hypothetical protein
MLSNENIQTWILRGLGTLLGVLVSLVIVAPEHTKAALMRVAVGVIMGFIFAPTIPHWSFLGLGAPASFLAGEGSDLVLARGAATGFVIWFVLEFVARLMSSTEWLEKMVKNLVAMRTKGAEDDR